MRALILDGSRKEDKVLEKAHNIIKERLEKDNWEVKSFILRDIQVAPCLGCFGCWIKTPGVCVINDLGREVARLASQSDMWVLITPVIFGGYSSELKKAIDRMICIGLPFFNTVKNEVRHIPRYLKRPILVGFGLLGEDNVSSAPIFKALVERNSNNFQSAFSRSEIFLSDDDGKNIANKIDNTLSGVI
ncbi:MAG: flavodoxin family protein [Candidatus Omnitrophica bacterium]|nr:flavodoxin family protein [Candidatus Omnitrophota bacterium]